MKYAVDRVEGKIIVLENLDTKEIKEIDIKGLNFKVNDGDILLYKNKKYYKDDALKQERLKIIQEKLNKVKSI